MQAVRRVQTANVVDIIILDHVHANRDLVQSVEAVQRIIAVQHANHIILELTLQEAHVQKIVDHGTQIVHAVVHHITAVSQNVVVLHGAAGVDGQMFHHVLLAKVVTIHQKQDVERFTNKNYELKFIVFLHNRVSSLLNIFN